MQEDHPAYFDFLRKLKKLIVPFESPFEKIRIGPKKDGSYVIADIPCDVCYSYGCDDNILFEKGLFERYGTISYTFDPFINGITECPDYIHFKAEGIAQIKGEIFDTLETHISNEKQTDNMLLKIDVESSEWPLLYHGCNGFSKFKQIVIEIHFGTMPFHGHDDYIKAVSNLLVDFKIIHMHANGYPIVPYLDFEFPKVIELTLLRNDLFVNEPLIDVKNKYPDPELDIDTIVSELKWWK
jgi:hypothetical protein